MLKVEGTKRDSRAEQAKKISLYPHFSICWGTSKQIIISIEYTEICLWLSLEVDTHTTVYEPLVRDYLVPEETFTLTPILIIRHPLSTSSIYYDP